MLKTNENSPDYTGLYKFLDVLNNEPDETFPQEIEKVLDIDMTLKFIAVSACIVHLDRSAIYSGYGDVYVSGKDSFSPYNAVPGCQEAHIANAQQACVVHVRPAVREMDGRAQCVVKRTALNVSLCVLDQEQIAQSDAQLTVYPFKWASHDVDGR